MVRGWKHKHFKIPYFQRLILINGSERKTKYNYRQITGADPEWVCGDQMNPLWGLVEPLTKILIFMINF